MTDEPEKMADRLDRDPGDQLCGLTEREIHIERIEAAEMIRKQAAKIERLREALRPFAAYLDTAAFDRDNNGKPLPDEMGMGWVYLTVGDFRRARAELEAIDDSQKYA